MYPMFLPASILRRETCELEVEIRTLAHKHFVFLVIIEGLPTSPKRKLVPSAFSAVHSGTYSRKGFWNSLLETILSGAILDLVPVRGKVSSVLQSE